MVASVRCNSTPCRSVRSAVPPSCSEKRTNWRQDIGLELAFDWTVIPKRRITLPIRCGLIMNRTARSFKTAFQPKSPRRGAVAVEMAIVLPALLLLVIGIVESSNLIYLKQSLTVAAYEGARASIAFQATTSDVESHANLIVADRQVQGSSIAISPTNFHLQPYGTYITVEVAAPYQSNSVAPGWFFQALTLKSRVRMMKEY